MTSTQVYLFVGGNWVAGVVETERDDGTIERWNDRRKGKGIR